MEVGGFGAEERSAALALMDWSAGRRRCSRPAPSGGLSVRTARDTGRDCSSPVNPGVLIPGLGCGISLKTS